MGVFGHNDNHWDQGMVFLTPDHAWLSPYGFAQAMIANASRPVTLHVVDDQPAFGPSLDLNAACSDDGTSFTMRIVNDDREAGPRVFIQLPPGITCMDAVVSVLRVPANLTSPENGLNPPSNMTQVQPWVENITCEH